MESEVFNNFRVKQINGTYYIVANSDQRDDMDLKIAEIPGYIRYPKAVAEAIVSGLNKNNKLCLIDLI